MKFFAPLNVLALTVLVGCVNAHGYIKKPLGKYTPNTVYTDYNCLTDASINKGFAGGIYNAKPEDNAKQFAEHWNATGYKSLREMLDPIAKTYGFSIATGDPVDVSGFTEMWWQNDEYKEGFIDSHNGPCECWIDDTRVFHYDDCSKTFRSFPAKIPTDYYVCKPGKKCLLVFYWMALHSPQWQVYKQCVPIINGGSGNSSATGDTAEKRAPNATSTTPEETPYAPATPPATSPATPPATPPATSPATPPATPPSTSYGTPATPDATTPAPLSTDFTPIETPAPASTPATDTSTETQGGKSASSCKRRKRRMQSKSE